MLGRRWGTDPESLRHRLTDAQFVGYLSIEGKAERNETMLQAHGTLAAILQAFSQKGSKVMDRFRRALEPGPADSALMGRMRGPIREQLELQGESIESVRSVPDAWAV